jgi:hypothetical protein
VSLPFRPIEHVVFHADPSTTECGDAWDLWSKLWDEKLYIAREDRRVSGNLDVDVTEVSSPSISIRI